MWFKRRRPRTRGHILWVDGGSGFTWEPHGVMDYGRFFVYRDSSGDLVALPRNLVTAIQEQGSEQHVGARKPGAVPDARHGQAGDEQEAEATH